MQQTGADVDTEPAGLALVEHAFGPTVSAFRPVLNVSLETGSLEETLGKLASGSELSLVEDTVGKSVLVQPVLTRGLTEHLCVSTTPALASLPLSTRR